MYRKEVDICFLLFYVSLCMTTYTRYITYYTEQVLIYHGALDIICHFPGAQEMLATTNWKGKEEFHKSERKALWLYNEVKYTIHNIIMFSIGKM